MTGDDAPYETRHALFSLKVLVAVAEELNMTRASRREHLVLPAAGKRLKDLEDRVAAQLLYRHARGVTLTPAGLALLHHARWVKAVKESDIKVE